MTQLDGGSQLRDSGHGLRSGAEAAVQSTQHPAPSRWEDG